MTADEAQEGDPLMGPSLIEWMTAHDVTIGELAKGLGGISPTTVKNWRSGQGMSAASRARLLAYMAEREAQQGSRQSSDRPIPAGQSGQTPATDAPNQTEPPLVSRPSAGGHPADSRPEGLSDEEWADLRAARWEAESAWWAKRATAAMEALKRATGEASSQSS